MNWTHFPENMGENRKYLVDVVTWYENLEGNYYNFTFLTFFRPAIELLFMKYAAMQRPAKHQKMQSNLVCLNSIAFLAFIWSSTSTTGCENLSPLQQSSTFAVRSYGIVFERSSKKRMSNFSECYSHHKIFRCRRGEGRRCFMWMQTPFKHYRCTKEKTEVYGFSLSFGIKFRWAHKSATWGKKDNKRTHQFTRLQLYPYRSERLWRFLHIPSSGHQI